MAMVAQEDSLGLFLNCEFANFKRPISIVLALPLLTPMLSDKDK